MRREKASGAIGWLLSLTAAVILVGAPATARTTEPSIPAEGRLQFEVWRDDSRIGSHRIDFRRDGADLLVEIAIDLKVEFASIPLFRYRHRNEERWRDGRLVALSATTDDDGDDAFARVFADDSGLEVEGSGFRGEVPPDLLPTSYWQAESIARRRFISSQDGRIFDVTVSDDGPDRVLSEGRMIEARRYLMRGDLDLDLWYDAAGQWVKLRFSAADGSVIDYRRVTPARDVETVAR